MKNKSVLFITILSIIILFHNCSKEENLILNEEYITVSDLHQYCGTRHYFNRTKCNECSKKCDGKEVKIKGHFYSDGFNNLSNNILRCRSNCVSRKLRFPSKKSLSALNLSTISKRCQAASIKSLVDSGTEMVS